MRRARDRVASTACAVLVLVVAALFWCAPAQAAYPGANGKIAFTRDGQIWTINANGTGETQLTTGPAAAYDPQWSPNGTRIAYTRGYGSLNAQVRMMNADGSGDVLVRGPWAFSPTWSPNGKRLALIAPYFLNECGCDIYVIVDANVDGSQSRILHMKDGADGGGLGDLAYSPRGYFLAFTDIYGAIADRELAKLSTVNGNVSSIAGDPGTDQFRGAWSPSADRVAYLDGLNDYSVATISPDGTGRTVVTLTGAFGVEWSPDGSKLVFSNRDLQVMNPDGSGRTAITHTAAEELDPDWQPVVGAAPPGYPRPRGATPLRVSLVPAFDACSAPNRTHGPPLAFGSCDPPAQSADYRTVGTPDFNGAAANMVGSVRLDILVGNPATAADEADVALSFDVTDIRCRTGMTDYPCSTANANGERDYAGRLRGRIAVRVTDRYNLPAPAGISPGTGDTLLTFDANCTDTSDTSIGATCSLSTTLDALFPAMVTEGDRAVMELGQVEIMDGSGNGQPTFGPVLLRQGLFIP